MVSILVGNRYLKSTCQVSLASCMPDLSLRSFRLRRAWSGLASRLVPESGWKWSSSVNRQSKIHSTVQSMVHGHHSNSDQSQVRMSRASAQLLAIIMESPRVLQQAKEDITASTEWESVIQDLCILLAEQTSGRQQLRSFEGLSKQEQHELMRRAASRLQRTSTFRELQSNSSYSGSTYYLSIMSHSLETLNHL